MMSPQKAFILTRSITATLQLSFPLLSNWTRRQKTTATWAAKEIASSVRWKIHKPLLKNGCIRSTTWPKRSEDRLSKLKMGILDDLTGQCCKGQQTSPPLVPLKFLFGTTISDLLYKDSCKDRFNSRLNEWFFICMKYLAVAFCQAPYSACCSADVIIDCI